MNIYQVSANEIKYETAKPATGTKISNEENNFRDILKNKSDKVNSDKGKTSSGKNKKQGKVKDNDLLTSNDNISVDNTPKNVDETPNITAVHLFSSEYLMPAQIQIENSSGTELVQNANIIVPVSNLGNNNVPQDLPIIQDAVVPDTESFGQSSLEGETALIENMQVNKTKTDGKNGQDLLNAVDVKKDNSVFAANYKSTQINEKLSEKLSEKPNLLSENDLPDETSSEAKALGSFVFNAKEDLVNIKVAEPYAEKSWEAAAEDIGEAVVQSVKNNKIEKLNISLNPKELGEIKVEFVMDNDKISVSLICSNEKTKSLLTENTDTLSRIIQSNLRQDTDVSVSYSEKSNQHESNSENYDGRGNNSHYKDDSQQNNRHEKDSDHDFLQKLRLGILDFEKIEV